MPTGHTYLVTSQLVSQYYFTKTVSSLLKVVNKRQLRFQPLKLKQLRFWVHTKSIVQRIKISSNVVTAVSSGNCTATFKHAFKLFTKVTIVVSDQRQRHKKYRFMVVPGTVSIRDSNVLCRFGLSTKTLRSFNLEILNIKYWFTTTVNGPFFKKSIFA